MKREKAVIFHHGITSPGGSERITLEEERYFNQAGVETAILAFYFDPTVFNGAYTPSVKLLQPGTLSGPLPLRIIRKMLSLRKAIQEIQPDYIVGSGEVASIYLFFSTLFTKYSYSVHVPQTIFWDLETYGDAWDITPFLLGRYSLVFKSVYGEIRRSTAGHMESLPESAPPMGLKQRVLTESLGLAMFIAGRRASHLFVLSAKMAWEVEKMYKRKAVIVKGAYPRSVISRRPVEDIKEKFNIGAKKMVLSVCRLTEKKRVDLTIRAFALLALKRDDAMLVIGGSGTVEKELRELADGLSLGKKVCFAGFIHENALYDYYSACDVFVSADHADYDITTFTALGFGKKVVWTVENETDPSLVADKIVFPADLDPESFAAAMSQALDASSNKGSTTDQYSWEKYFDTILGYLGSPARIAVQP